MFSYILIAIAILLVALFAFKNKFFPKKGLSPKEQAALSMDDRYNIHRKDKELELDDLLEKINDKGLQSLSKKEKQRLEELSQ
ncbi:hypothetical protein DBR32_04995 [Taibaiella sp. KBW10]|uniref:DUF6576 domain-containing protein n=1 Tax=Taibaiella sp. KBW10 TaxID=2153357 RepID=UPI000F59F99A|nr:DUF6576 domain-containing protein [Taibaiella sp. KBW10]RQO31323.1 hypothetical protein DBR32_04995 [Taibaiella sp. KBW10]